MSVFWILFEEVNSLHKKHTNLQDLFNSEGFFGLTQDFIF